MKNKWFWILSIIIALIVTYFTAVPKNETDTRKEVTVWTLQMGDFADYMNNIISKYESAHPDIKIKWIDVPFSEGDKRTLAAILSNNPPDLINLNPDFSAILAQKGTLYSIPENKLSEYNKDIVDSLKYKGNLFAIPWYATSAVTIYNKKLFEQAKLTDMPATYEDLAKYAKQVKVNTGKYIYLPTITENDTMLKILNKYGINSYSNINNNESVKVFNQFKSLYQNNLIPKESITQTHREALEKYMSENIVFFQGGANFLSMIKDNAPNVYKVTDVAPQIKGKLGQNDFSLMNFVIPLKAKYKDEALDFGLFLTNKENQLALAKRTNVISTNKEALTDSFYNSYDGLMSKARSISAKQISHIQPVMRQSNNQKDINTLVNTAVQSVLLNKDNTQNILNKLAKDWKNLS